MKRALSILALALTLVCAPSANASYDPLASGSTRIVLDRGFVGLLRSHGVGISAIAPAKLTGRVAILPVIGGEMDPTRGTGTVEHEGALLFTSAHRNVRFRALTVKAKKTPLLAKVGGTQLKVARAGRIASKREGFGEGFSATGLMLTQKVATRLDKKLGLGRLLREGQPFGSLTSKTRPATVELAPVGSSVLTPDPAFMAKLDSLFVAVNPIHPAQGLRGVYSFPITIGGAISPDASSGTLKGAGDLEFLQLGAGQVFWHELWLDLSGHSTSAELDVEPTPAFPGKIGRFGVFDLGPVTTADDPGARTISLTAPVAITAEVAATFNQAFASGKPPVFNPGDPLGTIAFTATGH